MEIIRKNSRSNVTKMIKLYLLKLLFNIIYKKDYIKFFNFKKDNNFSSLYEDFKYNFIDNKTSNKRYYFLPYLDDFQKYKEVDNEINKIINNKYETLTQDFKDYIQKYDIDMIYISVANIILSKNKKLDLQISKFLVDLIGNFDIPNITKRLFLLFPNLICKSNENNNSKNEEEYQNYLIILLNAFRICIQTSNIKGECLYYQIMKNFKKDINTNSIPGNGYSYNIYINNYYLIEKFLNNHQDNSSFGAYVCSCGLYYPIKPCGFPIESREKTTCQNCGKDIGYAPKPEGMKGNHGMVIRNGHYRIFYDLKQKIKELQRFGDNDFNIPNMILSDYKTNIIDQKMKEQELGINKPSNDIFKYNDIKIRHLSTVGYRLLNFILYFHLFFSNSLGEMSDERLE